MDDLEHVKIKNEFDNLDFDNFLTTYKRGFWDFFRFFENFKVIHVRYEEFSEKRSKIKS